MRTANRPGTGETTGEKPAAGALPSTPLSSAAGEIATALPPIPNLLGLVIGGGPLEPPTERPFARRAPVAAAFPLDATAGACAGCGVLTVSRGGHGRFLGQPLCGVCAARETAPGGLICGSGVVSSAIEPLYDTTEPAPSAALEGAKLLHADLVELDAELRSRAEKFAPRRAQGAAAGFAGGAIGEGAADLLAAITEAESALDDLDEDLCGSVVWEKLYRVIHLAKRVTQAEAEIVSEREQDLVDSLSVQTAELSRVKEAAQLLVDELRTGDGWFRYREQLQTLEDALAEVSS
jgi:hypothetical protein